jgi:hypothetical protein
MRVRTRKNIGVRPDKKAPAREMSEQVRGELTPLASRAVCYVADSET